MVGGGLHFTDNTVLPECLAIAFKDHLVVAHGFAGPWTITGNGASTTCP